MKKQKKQNIKITREEFHTRRQLIVSNAKHQIDNIVYNAKHQILEISKKIEDGVQLAEINAITIEKELLEKQNISKDNNIAFTQELFRKSVHFLSLSIPISYIFISKEIALLILIPLMFFFIIFDIATKRISFLRSLYLKIFGPMLRKHEINTKDIFLNGASWVLISAVLTIFIFPKIIAIIALTVLIISDVFAALIGRKFGKKKFLSIKNKSWEGTISFFISALIVTSVYGFIFNLTYFYFIIGFFASISAAMGEALAKEVLHSDDNLTIPISFGITMWFGNTFLTYFYNINFVDNIIFFTLI